MFFHPISTCSVWTDGLKVSLSSETGFKATPVFTSEGADLNLGLQLRGETQEGQLTARALDRDGVFAALTAIAKVSLRSLWQDRARLGRRLAALPMVARLSVPRRAVGSYPSFARQSALGGELEAAGVLNGSLAAPFVAISVRGYGVHALSAPLAVPVDVDLEANYDGKEARGRMIATRPEGMVLDAQGALQAPLDALLGKERIAENRRGKRVARRGSSRSRWPASPRSPNIRSAEKPMGRWS